MSDYARNQDDPLVVQLPQIFCLSNSKEFTKNLLISDNGMSEGEKALSLRIAKKPLFSFGLRERERAVGEEGTKTLKFLSPLTKPIRPNLFTHPLLSQFFY